MHKFEKIKGESMQAYTAFVEFREGRCNPTAENKRRQEKIIEWMNKWDWEERKQLYENHIKSEIFKRKYDNDFTKNDELKALLAELRMELTRKLRNSEEIEKMSSENLSKLVSMACKAIVDIAKAEIDLNMDKLENHSWAELADAIRNDPDAFKIASQLSDIIDKKGFIK